MAGAELQVTGVPENTEHREIQETNRLLESTIRSLVDFKLIVLARALYQVRRQNHLAAGSAENRASQQAPIANLLQVCGRLHSVSHCTSSNTTEKKTPKHKYLPYKVAEFNIMFSMESLFRVKQWLHPCKSYVQLPLLGPENIKIKSAKTFQLKKKKKKTVPTEYL